MKTALKYGGISGLLIVASWFVSIGSGGDTDFAIAEILGYIIMIVALSAVFMGIKSIRDQKGSLSFKEGFFHGIGITLVASVIYVVGWMIYAPNFAPDFAEKYRTAQIELIQQSDEIAEEKEEQIKEINEWVEEYKKPHVMAGMTFMEIFPIGLIVTLISALILKRK